MTNKIVVITGAAGSGKSVIFESLKKRHKSWAVVKSYTTRTKRPQEVDKKYMFVSKSDFENKVQTGEIIEYEEYAGHLYGTAKTSLENAVAKESTILMHLNIEGAKYIKKNFSNVIDIYLYVPEEELKKRVKKDKTRGQLNEAEYKKRFEIATKQNKQRNTFSYIVYNTATIPDAVEKIEKIIEEHK